MVDDDYEKIMRELKFEKVAKTIKGNPEDWSKELEKLGFHWFDDDYDSEEEEERLAKPENPNQEFLVGYFEGALGLSDQVLDTFMAEKESADPNYPLFRKYFKKGNDHLKKLLVVGLEKKPADIGLLNDLGYFHEFRNILGELIQLYLKACEEEDAADFEELVQDFCLHTAPDGFVALYKLEQKYGPETDKGKIVRKIRQEQDSQPEYVKF